MNCMFYKPSDLFTILDKKTDIRYVISYSGQSQFFEVLPLIVL